MKRNKAVFSGVTAAVLVVAIVIVANAVSMNLFKRLDLTEGRIYSLNPASKRIVGELEDTFLVKAFFSKNLPAPYNANAKYVQDKLEEYRAYGKGRFRYEFVDPADDVALEQDAQKHRIPPVQVQVVEQDQFQSKKAYMGLVFLYQDRQETIPVVDNPVGLEYEITASIKKLTRESSELPLIGILNGHQEPTLNQLTVVQQVFQKQYRLQAVDVSDGSNVPQEVTVLVIASPRTPLDDWAKYAVDQYIMNGGKVAFLIDKVNADLQFQRATPLRLEIDEWLNHYGFHVNDDLVADIQNPGMLSISQQEGFFRMVSQVPYPFIPSLREFNRSIVMVKDLERLSLFYASSIDTSLARERGVTIEPLTFTSPKTLLQEGSFNINPTQQWNPEQFDRGQIVLGAVVSGSFTSFFSGKEIPAPSDTLEAAPALEDTTIGVSPETRLVVLGDGEFFVDEKGGNDRDNLLFFQNMIDWLVQDEDLIAIRSREVTDRSLRPITPAKKRFVKYANALGSPLLVVVLGVVAWQMRRRRKVEI
ncbi:MAG: GldG family protein [Candidatus Latescibacterota bacterium]|nr:MAG: GldG family protein [Candidatus Latescibacterota bacterium]